MRFGKHVKLRHEKKGSVLFDTLREKVFVTDEIGGKIAQMILDGVSEDDWVGTLCQEFDADEETVKRDVTAFVECLEQNGLSDDGEDAA